jgi:hypothetical protein
VILWDVEAVRFLMGRMRHRMLLLTTFDQAKVVAMKKSTVMLAMAMITGMLACAKPDQSSDAGKYAVKVRTTHIGERLG